MTPVKTMLILNPNADLGRAQKAAPQLHALVEQYGEAVEWVESAYPRHAIELARQAAEQGFGRVVAVGGDGTVHEVINGLMQAPAERRPVLGVIPFGSGNDFALAAGYSNDPAAAIQKIFTSSPHRVDLGMVEDNEGRREYWDNTIGIGFDATVTIRSRNFTLVRGFLIYLFAVLQTILLNHHAPLLRVKSDLENWQDETLMLVLCNGGREGGGFMVSPQARNNDGTLDYASIRKVSRPMMLRLLPEVMKGTHGRFPQVRMGSFQRIQIDADEPLIIHMDGEIYAGLDSTVRGLTVEILPGALEVVA